MYGYEHADGIGSSTDLVIQGFIRMTSIAFVPVVVCAGILYLLVIIMVFVIQIIIIIILLTF